MDGPADVSVLIADDEQHIRTLIATIVRSIGFKVIGQASNGHEAANMARSHHPDLILLDINMPQKSGTEALVEIIEDCPDACVVMLTSLVDLQTVSECIEAGANAYIRKDTPLAEMKGIILSTWKAFIAEDDS